MGGPGYEEIMEAVMEQKWVFLEKKNREERILAALHIIETDLERKKTETTKRMENQIFQINALL